MKLTKEVISYLKEKNINTFLLDIDCAKAFCVEFCQDLKSIDAVIILGGDGTILQFSREYGKYELPIFTINLGRVGALTSADVCNWKELFEKVLNGNFYISKNLTLNCKITYSSKEEKEFIVYNDITLHRGMPNLFSYYITLNNTKKDKIYADGLIVATPSGSTAYNFSAGGPILSHGSNSFVITPICPQSKVFSSLVVSKEEFVNVFIEDEIEEVYLSIDGCDRYPISQGDVITISNSNISLCLIKFAEQDSIYEAVHKVIKGAGYSV